ncbi:MAG: Rieske 2Fe-2S domain-containing protein [Gammaproteobacteria bacterium]|jgi:Rieske Fe-S protein
MRRRRLLTGFCAFGLGGPGLVRSQTTDTGAASAAPREDDRLVFAFGSREGEVVAPADLAVGSPQVFAFPQDAESGTVRNGTRLNQVLVIRLEPDWLTEETRARSAAGIVAYSGVCTHTGCDIEDWDAAQNRFQCPCHESQFDPSDGARVVGGPAPWQLAALPLKLVAGELLVAGEFIGRIGFQQPGLNNPFGF